MMIFAATVILVILFWGETTSSSSTELLNENERFSKVRYLMVQHGDEIQTSRPLFRWGATRSSPTKPLESLALVDNVSEKHIKHNNMSTKENDKKSTRKIKSTKKNKNNNRRKRKRKHKRKDRRNHKKHNMSTHQLNLRNSTSLQKLIVKLNNNPETLPEDLLGKKKSKKSKNRNLINRLNVSNTIGHETRKYSNNIEGDGGKLKNSTIINKYSFYDPYILIDTTALAVTESIKFQEQDNKPTNKTNDEVNFSKLFNNLENTSAVCMVNNGGCAHFCTGNDSSICSCLDGFELFSDGKACIDINECFGNNGGCEKICENIIGSYYCDCPPGLRISDDLKTCEDVNECLLRNGHGPCQDVCTNTIGSYFCECSDLNGTRLANDGHTCEDVNECTEGKSGCSHGCINTHGRAFCTCPEGMQLENNWKKTCYDINECENEEINKRCKYGCLNTIGSYHCLGFLENEQNDQQIQLAPEHISCPPLFPPRYGFFHCSRKKAVFGFKARNGRLRITNRPGTYCELVCPKGYKNVGDFRVLCSANGHWIGEKSGECSLLSGRNFDLRYNYIDVTWALPKPKIKCPNPMKFYLEPGQKTINVKFPPPKANVNWRYVESDPVWAKALEANLTQGHHWITFKATDPRTNLTSKCIIYVVVKKYKI